MATTFTVGGFAATLTASALTTVKLPHGTPINPTAVVITDADATAIKADLGADTSATPTTARSSGQPFNVDFSGDNKILNILVDSTKYSLTVEVLAETSASVKSMDYHVGWWAARFIEDDFDAYDDGSEGAGAFIPLNFQGFNPKYVINVTIIGTTDATKGFIGQVDLPNKKLYVYRSAGAQTPMAPATRAQLLAAGAKYRLILME